jgi:phage tail-like protein
VSALPADGGAIPRPVGSLRFTVMVNGQTLGYFSECSGLSLEYEVYEYKEGGQNDFVHKLPTRLKYPNLVLKRGVTDENRLVDWLLERTRRSITVSLHGGDGQPLRSWAFDRAYPVKWQGPTLSASSTNAATETLEIVHQGLTRGANA